MSLIPVPAETLQKTAEFVAAVTPRLEKQASEKEAFDGRVPGLVDLMIQHGAVSPENREVAIGQLTEGGLGKVAEVIESLASHIEPRRMGTPAEKTASASYSNGKPESDRRFEEILMG